MELCESTWMTDITNNYVITYQRIPMSSERHRLS
jgi:hypothetical protein